jgi:hypothetical protein
MAALRVAAVPLPGPHCARLACAWGVCDVAITEDDDELREDPDDVLEDRDDLRAEVSKLLSAALVIDSAHIGEIERRDELHIRETERRDVLHHDEMARRQDAFDDELDSIRVALETRDLIGQAKGIIISTMRCSADEAFLLLKKQSQAQQLKLNEVAAQIVAAAQRRPDSTK